MLIVLNKNMSLDESREKLYGLTIYKMIRIVK